MTYTVRTDILSALHARLLTTAGLSAWLVIYTNREPSVEPDPETQHIVETLFTSSSDDTGVGQAVRWREIVGTWQLLLSVPNDSDVFPALAFADVLEATFLATPALTLSDGSTAIRLSSVLTGEPRAARKDDPWVRIPVVFKYTVNTHT